MGQNWPSPQDYNEAIQNPAICFADPELKGGEVELDAIGLPRPISGSFASVYKMRCAARNIAVRCFLQEGDQQQERYEAISNYFLHQGFKFAVPFVFIRQGIKIGADWYPILKMEWVEGITLDQFVRNEAGNPAALLWLAEELRQLVEDMQARRIAHGDLQHANLIVHGQSLLLVDYDGVYVPQLKGMSSAELGHRNYQHPRRQSADFDTELDNFSIWVIYVSLRILAADPGLIKCADEDFESLLFCRDDFVNPEGSVLFHLLEQHRSKEVVRNARLLRAVLKQPYPRIPRLSERMVIDRCVGKLKPLKQLPQGPSPWQKAFSAAVSLHNPPTVKDPNEELRFWYPYLLNKYKRKLHANEALLALTLLSIIPAFFASAVFLGSAMLFGFWVASCFLLKDASKEFQRAAYILAESQGIPISYELKMGSSMLGFPEVFLVFQKGEIPLELRSRSWSISNWHVMADNEKRHLQVQKNKQQSNGELYFDPLNKTPIAVFSGNLLLWLI
ncbi:MAG: hypothetical protein K2X27_01590 [Candidatus Obscuribacterales bacterium]|nr:hypothetical protein [Candidatus Obscuribacterales bacterium]